MTIKFWKVLCFLFSTAVIFATACTVELEADSDNNRNAAIDGVTPGDSGNGNGTKPGGGNGSGPTDQPTQPDNSVQPGGTCNCDSECAAVEGHPGICVYGVCMNQPSAECSEAGSTVECNTGSRCWSMQGESGSICWPNCSDVDCMGTCDADGSCVPDDKTSCDYSCGSYCACQEGDCATGEQCINGQCVPQAVSGDAPGPGPGPTCTLPDRDCTGSAAYCGELIYMDPRLTAHYDDYPINGETSYTDQYRSYMRRDLVMLVNYATAKTLCKTAAWTTGNGGPLGLGDMSEANGAIPGTAINQPGHPKNTHTNGFDIDLAYYQKDTPDNRLRPICQHADYHCSAAPHLLDVWRTAMFLGAIFESPRVRVVGVDGQAGQLLTAAISELCQLGWLDSFACSNAGRLAYEVTNMGYGWFHFHHHHAHISLCPGNAPCTNATSGPSMAPIGPGMNYMPLKAHPRLFRFAPGL